MKFLMEPEFGFKWNFYGPYYDSSIFPVFCRLLNPNWGNSKMLIKQNKTNISLFQTIARIPPVYLLFLQHLKNNLFQVNKTRKSSKSSLSSLLMILKYYLKMFIPFSNFTFIDQTSLLRFLFSKVSAFCLHFSVGPSPGSRVCCMEEPSWELCYKSEQDGTIGQIQGWII